ncbi:MAG: sigma-70 family RNA polymerase sigma factor [Planctomycetes bacterium]|nr:sigma-70 family RNA polymerase sigma factor [Planctomycetota bacterium]NOG53495.1 sigma-70 family RNA polymerase sigma factor [Planctomycetota bacterium]
MPEQPATNLTTSDPATWVDAHGDILFRYAVKRVRDRETAEELVQETLLAALQNRDSFSGKSAEQTWFISILRNKIVDHIRKRARERDRFEPTPDETYFDAKFAKKGKWSDAPVGWSGSNLSPDELREFRAALDLCADKLPPALAHVFSLRELDQMDSDSICKVLSITPTNLWTRLHRMRITLRECLEVHWLGDAKTTPAAAKEGC